MVNGPYRDAASWFVTWLVCGRTACDGVVTAWGGNAAPVGGAFCVREAKGYGPLRFCYKTEQVFNNSLHVIAPPSLWLDWCGGVGGTIGANDCIVCALQSVGSIGGDV